MLALVVVLSCMVIVMAWKVPGGAYIHIPFCRRRCYYCDFPIKVVGDGKNSQDTATSAYVDVLLREITSAALEIDETGMDRQAFKSLETVYFGGGTPSLLRPDQVGKILSTLDDRIGAIEGAEITLEMDPGTFDRDTAIAFAKSGVNRVSLGVQSFDDAVLKSCGRAHRTEDVYRAFDDLTAAGIENVSVDLISSLPHVSEDLWENTLNAAVGTGCPHISVYDLQIEDGTAFGRWYSPGVFPLPSNEHSASMYALAVKTLCEHSNFEHYEVSNYAKSGFRSRHNQRYWRCDPTWGFGMGAASYICGERVTRPTTLKSYEEWVDTLSPPCSSPVGTDGGAGVPYSEAVRLLISPLDGDVDEVNESFRESKFAVPQENNEAGDVDGDDDALEVIMLALRTSDGLDLAALGTRYGPQVANQVVRGLQDYIEKGLVVASRADGGESASRTTVDAVESIQHVRLKDPEGFLLSNDIIASVFSEFLE